jgi:glycosyltransferase involved in cell wall biosynthesis
MRVSAVIPALNAAAFLDRAVASLLATGYPDLEIVIVVDASDDDTLDVARALERQFSNAVRVRDNGARRGVSFSRNAGIAASTGEALCFLDADDYVFPNRFEACTRILAADPSVDAVYERTVIAFEDPTDRSSWVEHGDFGLAEVVESEALLAVLLDGRCWHTGGIVCRRSLLERTGGFDERMRIAEDCNLWFRLATAGRVVAGDMAKPVSAYVRHSRNTYWNRLEHKLDMTIAMARAYQWAITKGYDTGVRRIFSRAIRDFVWHGVVVARQQGRPRFAWRLIGALFRERCGSLLLDARLTRQIPRLTVEVLATLKRGSEVRA